MRGVTVGIFLQFLWIEINHWLQNTGLVTKGLIPVLPSSSSPAPNSLFALFTTQKPLGFGLVHPEASQAFPTHCYGIDSH